MKCRSTSILFSVHNILQLNNLLFVVLIIIIITQGNLKLQFGQQLYTLIIKPSSPQEDKFVLQRLQSMKSFVHPNTHSLNHQLLSNTRHVIDAQSLVVRDSSRTTEKVTFCHTDSKKERLISRLLSVSVRESANWFAFIVMELLDWFTHICQRDMNQRQHTFIHLSDRKKKVNDCELLLSWLKCSMTTA